MIDSGFNCPKPCYQNWSCVIKSQISGDNVYRDVDFAYFCCCTISISSSALGTLGQLHQQMGSFHLTTHHLAAKKIIPLKTKNHPTEEEKNPPAAKPNINLFEQHSVELIVELESLAKKSKHYKKCKRVEKAEKIKFGGK